MASKIAVVINKDGGSELAPSETFLHAHINHLPFQTFSLIGNPGYRVIREGSSMGAGRYLVSRTLLPLSYRWLYRHVFGVSVARQDTKALARWLEHNKIDLVLAEYGPTAVTVMDACESAAVPLVAHFHGYDAYVGQLLRDYGAHYQRLFDKASGVIGVSKHMCEQLISLGAPEAKVHYNACGADVTSNPRRASRIMGHRFCMIGRLVEKKAPFISLMAFARLCSDIPDATLEIVGDGPLAPPCEQLIRALNLENKVTLHGARPHAFVMEVLKRSDCFLQHSVKAPNGDMEGTPVGLLEAMGMGLPIVSTRHGGICDIVSENVTGLLVDEYDIEGMYLAMKYLCEDSAIATQMGLNARESVINNWTAEKSLERLAAILRAVSA